MTLFVSGVEAYINCKGGDQQTALHLAVFEDHFAIVQFLLKQPTIEIERTNGEEETPVLYAARLKRPFI